MLKPGDIRRVRTDLAKIKDPNGVTDSMVKLAGQTVLIGGVFVDGSCVIPEDDGVHLWTEAMFEPVPESPKLPPVIDDGILKSNLTAWLIRHRERAVLTCPEDCICWEVEHVLEKMEIIELRPTEPEKDIDVKIDMVSVFEPVPVDDDAEMEKAKQKYEMELDKNKTMGCERMFLLEGFEAGWKRRGEKP